MEDQLYDLLREFDNWQPDNLTDKSAIHLWQTLVRIASKYGLHDWFTVSMKTLEAKSRLGRSTIYVTINTLCQKGLLEVKSRKGNQSAKYRVLPFCVPHRDTSPDTKPDESRTQSRTQSRTINEGGRDRRTGLTDGLTSPLLQPRAREGGPGLAWAGERLTQRQRLYLGMLEAMEPNIRDVRCFAGWLQDGRFTDAQISGALDVTKSRYERGKVDYPFDYLHTMLLDWERRGVRTRDEVADERGYRPVAAGLFDDDEEDDGLWRG